MPTNSISVLILTKNEEKDISGCLESVKWCDDIHVFDSFSDDKTVDIAQKGGATVIQREFSGYASQKNAALMSCRFRHSWILLLDADERVPHSLLKEINDTLPNVSSEVAAFRIRRRDFLFGQHLKHAQITPWYIRLVRKGHAQFEREINEVIRVDGKVSSLREPFNHFPFSKGISHWLDKHNRYSSMEAEQWIKQNREHEVFQWSKALFARDHIKRRYHQKGVFYKLPSRPLIKWLYMVLWRRSFLDGAAGLTYATLQSIYEYFIVLKTRELLLAQSKPSAETEIRHLHKT